MGDDTSRWWRPAALALALHVCAGASCKEPPPPPPVPAKPEIVDSGPLEKLTAPAGVLLFGGTDDPLAALGQVDKLAGSLAAAKPETVARALQGALRLASPAAIDLGKRMRTALVLAGEGTQWIVAFGTKNRDQLVRSLPPGARQSGETRSYPLADKRTAHVGFVDDYAVVTVGLDVLARHRDFVKRLLGTKVGATARIEVAMAEASKRWAAELERAPARAREQLGGAVEAFAGLVRSLESLSLVLDTAADGGALLKLDATLKDAPPATKGALSLLDRLPPSAAVALVLGSNADQGPAAAIAAWALRLAFGGSGVPSNYSGHLARLVAATQGAAYVGHTLEDGDLRITMLAPVGDAKAAQEATAAVLGLFAEKQVKEGYAKRGLDLALKRDAYKVGDVPVTAVEVQVTDKSAGFRGAGRELFESLVNTHVAVSPELQLMTFGREARSTMEAWLGGKIPGGLDKAPGVARARKNAAPSPLLFLYASPIAMARAITIDGKRPFAAALPAASPSDTADGIALSVGVEAKTVHLVLDVPPAQARGLIQLMTMAKGLR